MRLWHAEFAVESGGRVTRRKENVYAASALDVQRALVDQGHHPIDVRPFRPPFVEWSDVRTVEWRLQLLRALGNQMRVMSNETALLRLIEEEEDPRRKNALTPARAVLMGGGHFSQAIEAIGLFDKATLAILNCGEESGDMGAVIEQAVKLAEDRMARARLVKKFIGIVAFDVFSILSMVYGTQFVYLPYLWKSGVQSADPAAVERFRSQVAMAWAANTALTVLCTVVIGAGLAFGAVWWANRKLANDTAERFIARFPLVGAYLTHVSLGETCRMLARLLRGGVGLTRGMEMVAENAFDVRSRDYWRVSLDLVLSGQRPQKALARPPFRVIDRYHLASFTTNDELAHALEFLSEERMFLAGGAQRRIARWGVMSLVGVFMATLALTLWTLWIQNEGLMQTMGSSGVSFGH